MGKNGNREEKNSILHTESRFLGREERGYFAWIRTTGKLCYHGDNGCAVRYWSFDCDGKVFTI